MKTKEQEVIDTPNTTKKEVKLYDYAHLVLFCGQCGHKQILEENISKERGIQINLPPTSTAELVLVCSQCKSKMGLFYVEVNNKDKEQTKEEANESVQENSIAEVESV